MGQMAIRYVVANAAAGIGFLIGGPVGANIGWMVGPCAWGILDPGRTVDAGTSEDARE